MLKPSLIAEFVEKNKLPIEEVEGKKIGCIEYSKTPFKIRFPGGSFGLASLFLSGAYLYGFKLNLSSFKKHLPNLPHPKNCFHIAKILKKPEEFYLNKTELESFYDLVGKPQKKIIKEKLLFIISGPFTLKGSLTIETEEGKEEIQALIINMDATVEFIKNLCQKALEKKAIELSFGLDLEYLTQTMLDLFQDHLWQNTVKHYKDIPIYKVHFNPSGKYKITEFGRI